MGTWERKVSIYYLRLNIYYCYLRFTNFDLRLLFNLDWNNYEKEHSSQDFKSDFAGIVYQPGNDGIGSREAFARGVRVFARGRWNITDSPYCCTPYIELQLD